MLPKIKQLLTTFKFLVILIRRHQIVITTYSHLHLLLILIRKCILIIAKTHPHLMAPVIKQLLTTFKFLVILIRRHLLVIATYSQLLLILYRKDLQVIAKKHDHLMFAKFKELLKSFKYLLKAKKLLTLKIDCDVSFLKDWFMY